MFPWNRLSLATCCASGPENACPWMASSAKAAVELGIRLTWRGSGAHEKAFDGRGQCVVAVDPRYFRPAEVDTLVGDASKARAKLRWEPKVSFRALVAEMVGRDLKIAERDQLVANSGYRVHSHSD